MTADEVPASACTCHPPETGDTSAIPMSRKVVLGRLQDAVSGQYPVRLERDQEWWADDINGFVVGVSDRWVAVQELADSVYVDGYEVVRMEDITDIEDDRESGYIERAVAGLGRPV